MIDRPSAHTRSDPYRRRATRDDGPLFKPKQAPFTAAIVVLAVVLMAGCGEHTALRAVPVAASAAPVVSVPPPCIHEVCSERLRDLTCVAQYPDNACKHYVFGYEQRCDPDKWGPVPTLDGGTG